MLKSALINLASEGITSVYCEGGSTLAASLLSDNFVDELIIFTAGLIIGGDGLPTVASLGLDNIKDARRLNLVETIKIDGDVMSRWSFN